MTSKKKSKVSPESIVREIKRRTRRNFTAKEKIRIIWIIFTFSQSWKKGSGNGSTITTIIVITRP
jgi:hypothetical protein